MFPDYRVCFADHVSAVDDFSEKLPVIAIAKGCEIIEKHICLNRNKTKYDKFSALHYNQIKNVIIDFEKYSSSFKIIY